MATKIDTPGSGEAIVPNDQRNGASGVNGSIISKPRAKQVADRFSSFGQTIFTEISALANQHKAVNLGQGFPDFDGADFVKEAAIQAIKDGKSQYALMTGVPDLAAVIAEVFERDTGIRVDPKAEVTVTSGCTEAIASAFLGLCNPGDEVIVFEPAYDSYKAAMAMAGAVVKPVVLRPPDFSFSRDDLRAAFSNRTRAILINTPHNPTGRVFTKSELRFIADLATQHDSLVLSDEVYHRLLYNGSQHISIAQLPNMYNRTITLNSLGKTFSLTGWKIGWAIAPPPLSQAIRMAHQFVTFSVATPLQHGAVAALKAPPEFYEQVRADYTRRRDILLEGLKDVGFKVYEPQGSFFVMADFTPFGFDDDVAFSKFLIEKVGVAGIPPSGFYSNPAEGKRLIRFAFCKTDAVLLEAVRRLKKHLKPTGSNV